MIRNHVQFSAAQLVHLFLVLGVFSSTAAFIVAAVVLAILKTSSSEP